ncbi:MAG: septum site-determining protein MinD [Ruminococcaceae bacterium]|nr:septum site-determining protein MinD [Oscillospiraceae bacterium]
MGKVIAITSGKGGTGKSTFSVGLAMGFSKLSKKVLLIDLDEGLRCLDLILGIDKELVFDLADILGERNIEDAIYHSPYDSNIDLIPAPDEPGQINADSFSLLIANLIGNYDYIIIDFPAGIDFSLYTALPVQTQFIAVCCPDPVSVRDAAVVCNRLPTMKKPPLFVINRFVYEDIRSGYFRNIDDIIDQSGFRLLGIVPESEELIFLSVNHKLKRRGRSSNAFLRISSRLNGEHIRLPKPKKI